MAVGGTDIRAVDVEEDASQLVFPKGERQSLGETKAAGETKEGCLREIPVYGHRRTRTRLYY